MIRPEYEMIRNNPSSAIERIYNDIFRPVHCVEKDRNYVRVLPTGKLDVWDYGYGMLYGRVSIIKNYGSSWNVWFVLGSVDDSSKRWYVTDRPKVEAIKKLHQARQVLKTFEPCFTIADISSRLSPFGFIEEL